ncbi:hypothetical protein J4E90_010397 [Alternaria incomplexa]|uniref:uncharacterized protein n=1 Tax=Alternaria incomplexa TaxID=1187928 RepID=UPI00221F6F84|nr:uncharacterized protein J4E90_010397 [Alternaria incomplexa]KAI4906504.1 hypothetical protein J4E90_010397 [Alternaria incomplexa]
MAARTPDWQFGDIIYLLDTGRKNIQHYDWENEENVEPVPIPSTSTTLVDGDVSSVSNESEESTTVSNPFPHLFDASEKACRNRIAITIQSGPEVNNTDDVRFDGFVARFQVGEWTLMKGRSTESERQAMVELFARVHSLAQKYREKDEEDRVKAEERRIAREKEAEEAVVE